MSLPAHLPEVDNLAHSIAGEKNAESTPFGPETDILGSFDVLDGLPTGSHLEKCKADGSWDIADPAHRGCTLVDPCLVTGEKSCARTTWIAKFNHTYGLCGVHTGSEDHILCQDFSGDERRLYPPCADCGLILETRHLILIHQRILAEDKALKQADVEQLRTSLSGYERARKTVTDRHVRALRARSGAAPGPGSDTLNQQTVAPQWWIRVVSKVMKKVSQICRAFGLRK